ncbi:MAG: hypothetical protein ABIL01_04085 [Pseudomonadota bacterium]
MKSGDRVKLPKSVAKIYEAVAELSAEYPGRPFTPDGHLIGSIGGVVARETFGFELHEPSNKHHDARCSLRGDAEVKITAGNTISMRGPCNHLIVLKVVSPRYVEIIFDGSGIGLWEDAGKTASNGQPVYPWLNSEGWQQRISWVEASANPINHHANIPACGCLAMPVSYVCFAWMMGFAKGSTHPTDF